MTIPRSTQAGRAHGPVRAHQSAGNLQGPAPVAHQVRAITVRVEQLPDGQWLLTQSRAPGWARAVRTPADLAAAMRQGFTEAQISAHSDWRGHVYDAAVPTYRRNRPASRTRRRCDVYAPTEWRLHEDGRWVSPRGHKYPEQTQAVQNVMAARRSMGLPARPDPVMRQNAARMVVQVAEARRVTQVQTGLSAPIRLGQLVIQRQRQV